MAQIKVYYDHIGNTLTVWFGDSQEEYICEETGKEVVLMKNKLGQVIGFEKLNYMLPKSNKMDVVFETFGMWADRDDMPVDSVDYVNAIREG
ncbi:MAG: DUF2283 domain-containing protein [Chloroflexota bacterium]|nr:DUF2283 domain-containing protein [Chloroflexota bacterium]